MSNNVPKFNAYYSPVGIRFGGNFSGFVEFGIGYKGVLNGGLSYKFNTIKRRFHGLAAPSPDAVILLPGNYPPDSDLRYLETINSRKRTRRELTDFDKQINNAAATAKADGGNVFKVTDIRIGKAGECSTVAGEVYYSADYDSFKTEVENKKNEALKNSDCAYIVIYMAGKPAYRAALTINDTGRVVIANKSKQVLKVTKEGIYKISSRKNIISIDARFGHTYYLKTYLYRGKSMLSITDDVQGELESSLYRTGK